MSRVSGNDAVSYLHLADLFWGRAIWIVGGEDQIFDGDVTTAECSVVKNGTKGEVSSYKLLYYGGRVIALNGTLVEDAPAIAVGLIIRDGAIVQREYAFVGDAAAAVATDKGCVARDVA